MEDRINKPIQTGTSNRAADCVVLFVLVLIASLPFVFRLGFYSDDWETFSLLSNHSFVDGVQAFTTLDPHMKIRPIQLAYLVLNFRLFGLHPLGYHVFSIFSLGILSIFLYVTTRALLANRSVAFTVALVFCLLPYYSTDRVWISSQQAVLCMIFALIGIYALHRAMLPNQQKSFKWFALSALTFVLSLLSYEIGVGLILAALAVAAGRTLIASRAASRQVSKSLASIACIAALFLGLFLLKARFQSTVSLNTRSLDRFLEHMGALLVHALEQMLQFNFWTFGLRMPKVLLNLYRVSALHSMAIVTSLALALLVSVYLYRSVEPGAIPNRRVCLRLAAFSIVLFFIGYGMFFPFLAIDFTTAGLANRISMVAALGPAFLLVAVAGLLASLLPTDRSRATAFSVLIGLFCGANCLAMSGIGSLWADAASQQTAIIQSLTSHVTELPHGSTLLLDGFCRYRGPGVVFETDWDATGAVRLAFHDFSLKSDVVSPNLRFDGAAAVTTMYGKQEGYYPYSDRLFVFNTQRETLTPLPGKDAANAYLRSMNPHGDSGCPPGREGFGAVLF